MYKIALLVLCAQALLIQNAFGQSLCGSPNQGLVNYGGINQLVSSGCGNNLFQSVVSSPAISQVQIGNAGSSNNGGFGGNGIGQLGVVGDIPIGGTTYVDGTLPVVGIVEFNGALPAGGFVTIVGNTPCQCGNYGNYGLVY